MDANRKEDFEKLLRNNTTLVRRVQEILDAWDAEISSKELTVDDFKEPNWANKQAFRNGDRSRIKKVRDLFTF